MNENEKNLFWFDTEYFSLHFDTKSLKSFFKVELFSCAGKVFAKNCEKRAEIPFIIDLKDNLFRNEFLDLKFDETQAVVQFRRALIAPQVVYLKGSFRLNSLCQVKIYHFGDTEFPY